MIFKMFGVVLLLFYVAISKAAADETLSDAYLNFTELAIKYTLPCKEYDVTTEDGYILKLFHVPGDKTRPVLLMHGLLNSADSLIIRGNLSIVYFLSKAGYDVWASNFRGNKYTRRHATLDPDTDSAFWDFSMHEHGLYDLSTSIDFILNKTKAKRLSYIGYSEGNVLMYILASLRPEYNDKINIFVSLAPICHVQYLAMRVPQILIFGPILRALLFGLNIVEILNYDSAISIIGRNFCMQYPLICIISMWISVGYDPGGIDPEHMRVLSGHVPAGTSRKNLEHYYQVMTTQRFAQFDAGPMKNLAIYNSPVPPVYDLRKNTMKVAIFIAENDVFSTPEDVSEIRKLLPNIVFYKKIKNFNHLSFVHSRYAGKLVYSSVIQLLKKYS